MAVKKLKSIIGVKGERFAKLVGIPLNTLKSIESGRNPLTHDMAWKIRAATGVTIDSIMLKSAPMQDFPKEGEFTLDGFIQWRGRLIGRKANSVAIAEAAEAAESVWTWAMVLFLSCIASKKKSTVYALSHALGKCLSDLADQNDLKKSIADVLVKYPLKECLVGTKIEWQAASQDERDAYGITEQRLKRTGDYDEIKGEAVFIPRWHPDMGAPPQVTLGLREMLTSKQRPGSV